MIDFGLSKHFESGDVQNEQVGSRYTCAPEILKGRYDEKCDIWAIGVITYLLLWCVRNLRLYFAVLRLCNA